jgi:hypothetical protein
LCGALDANGLFEHPKWLIEQRGIFAEECEDWLACLELCTKLCVRFDARVRADGVTGFRPACAETLHGPANLLAVHASEIAIA